MPRRYKDLEGGKLPSSKQINRSIRKGFNQAGKFLKDKVAPELTTLAIPVAASLAGAAGDFVGGPLGGLAASQLTESVLKHTIPQKYQSKNVYTNAAANLMSDYDTGTSMGLGIGRSLNAHSTALKGGAVEGDQADDNSTPYDDLIDQAASNTQSDSTQQINYNAFSDSMYNGGQMQDTDRIQITAPPFQQREGSSYGLLGAGIKRKKGRKPGKTEIIHKVEIVKRRPYERYSHAPNLALRQLLESQEMKRDYEDRKSQRQLNKNIEDMSRYIRDDMANVRSQMEELERERNFYKEALGAGIHRPRYISYYA